MTKAGTRWTFCLFNEDASDDNAKEVIATHGIRVVLILDAGRRIAECNITFGGDKG